MGTVMPLTQMGPSVAFLPPMGLSMSVPEVPHTCCYRSKVILRGDFFGCYSTSSTSLSSWRMFCPLTAAAKTLPTVSGSHRKQSAFSTNTGIGIAHNLKMRPGRNSGNAGFEKVKVRSLVDEATAHSSDLEEELKIPSSTSQRNDGTAEGKSSGFELHGEEIYSRGGSDYEVGVDSSESETFSDYGERDCELGGGIANSEEPPNPIEMDYEDMQVGRERNWSIADMKKMDVLRNFEYTFENEKGDLLVLALRAEHMKPVEELLVDSFAELMGGLLTYRPLLTLTVRQYVRDRYACLPDAVTLVGVYAPVEENLDMDDSDDIRSRNCVLAGTVELSFSIAGHPDIPAGPSPPPCSPYLCNMAVSSAYRRRGVGQQMLKAAETLAESQGCEDMYLHCRMVDTAPLNMYKAAGYEVVATDSLLSLLSFQRRRYLMMKKLHPPSRPHGEEPTSRESL